MYSIPVKMFKLTTVCFVTGASRGLGESIAMNLAMKLRDRSAIVLLARNKTDLEAVHRRLRENTRGVTIVSQTYDQSCQDPEYFEALFYDAFEGIGRQAREFEQAIIVHNAGSIQPMRFIRNLPPVKEVTQYMNINFSGVVALTTEFLRFFQGKTEGRIRHVVINISSLAALQPFKSWALYCSGKAARDMFFKVLAAEEEKVRVLSYAPGPLKTDMTDAIIRDSEDKGLQDSMAESKTKDKLLTCDESVAKLIAVLENDMFESGAHVDYYDEIPSD